MTKVEDTVQQHDPKLAYNRLGNTPQDTNHHAAFAANAAGRGPRTGPAPAINVVAKANANKDIADRVAATPTTKGQAPLRSAHVSSTPVDTTPKYGTPINSPAPILGD